jgi:hypothetical protein
MTVTSVLNQITQRVLDALWQTLSDETGDDDPTKARLIRAGLLQDDPTRYKISILVQPNDQDGDIPEWRHILAPKEIAPPYEIGGSEMWLRRFTVILNMFWRPSLKREAAMHHANILLSKAEDTLTRLSMTGVGPDTFGETALDLRVKSSHLSPGGGDGQFINYGKIWFEVLTGKDRAAA